MAIAVVSVGSHIKVTVALSILDLRRRTLGRFYGILKIKS